MKKIYCVVTCLVLAAAFLFSATVWAQTEDKMKTYLADLDYIYTMGEELYCYWDLKAEMDGLNWKQVYDQARSEMLAAKNDLDYARILTKMVSAVHDGHVNVFFNGRLGVTSYYMPMSFNEVDGGRVAIVSVNAKAFLGEPGVEAGDEVLEVDGVPIAKLIERNLKYVSGSTEGMRRRQAIRRIQSMFQFFGMPKANPVLKIRSFADSKVRTEEVPWLIYNSETDPFPTEDTYDITQYIRAKILPGNVGYLKLGSMATPESLDNKDKEAQEKFQKYAVEQLLTLINTKSIIIDLRNNGGGSSAVGDELTRYFIDKSMIRYRYSPRLSKAMFIERPYFFSEFTPDPSTNGRFAKWKNMVLEPADESLRYHGKIVVITNAGCYSACDTFADGLASNKLATIIGEGTGGGTGWPLKFDLPSGNGSVRFSTTRGWSNFDRYLEGTGTLPNIKAFPTASDYATGEDSVMLKAYKVATSGATNKSETTVASAKDSSQDFVDGADFRMQEEDVIPVSIEETRERELSDNEFPSE